MFALALRLPVIAIPAFFLLCAPVQGAPPTVAEISKTGKAGTAVVTGGGNCRTAFCIHSSGLFLVNWPVDPEPEKRGPVTLVLNPGLPTQKIVEAHVVRADQELELMLVQVKDQKNLPALPLGLAEEPAESAELVVCGSPINAIPEREPTAFKAIAAEPCKVKALQRKQGQLERIQLNRKIGFGWDGAPLLDRKGRVVGVMSTATDVSADQAFPIRRVIRSLARPDILLTPPNLTKGNLDKPAWFQVRARQVLPDAKPLNVELFLHPGDAKEKKVALEHTAGVYRGKLVPSPLPREAGNGINYAIAIKYEGQEVSRLKGTLPIHKGSQAPAAAGIKRAPLAQDKVVLPLPGQVTDLAVGGGGRYLILHIPEQHKLAVFDVNEAKIRKYIDAPGEGFKFAAGQEDLMLFLPEKKLLERWSLDTLARVASAPVPVKGKVEGMVMGSASSGPLMLQWSTEVGPSRRQHHGLVDVQTLKMTQPDALPEGTWAYNDSPISVRVSADGRTFGIGGVSTLVLRGNAAESHEGHNIHARYLAPGHDGKLLFSNDGLFTHELKRPGGIDLKAWEGIHWPLFVPAHSRHYFCLVEPAHKRAGLGAPPLADEEESKAVMAVYLTGSTRPLIKVPDMLVFRPEIGREGPLPADKHFHLIPDAELLVFIPLESKDLILRRVKVAEALDKSGIDYLFVQSEAPPWAKRGTTYTYRIAVKSKKGGVKCKLESGPKGMTVSDKGEVTWRVPADIIENETKAIVGIRDAGGQERLHIVEPRIE